MRRGVRNRGLRWRRSRAGRSREGQDGEPFRLLMEASTAVTAGQRGYSFFVSGCATALEIGETKSGERRDENSKREASTKCFDLLYFFL